MENGIGAACGGRLVPLVKLTTMKNLNNFGQQACSSNHLNGELISLNCVRLVDATRRDYFQQRNKTGDFAMLKSMPWRDTAIACSVKGKKFVSQKFPHHATFKLDGKGFQTTQQTEELYQDISLVT